MQWHILLNGKLNTNQNPKISIKKCMYVCMWARERCRSLERKINLERVECMSVFTCHPISFQCITNISKSSHYSIWSNKLWCWLLKSQKVINKGSAAMICFDDTAPPSSPSSCRCHPVMWNRRHWLGFFNSEGMGHRQTDRHAVSQTPSMTFLWSPRRIPL